jgi:hypothetical protein
MERANRPDNPVFVRLADLAVAFAGPNGHAEFGHGELTRFLGVDYRTVDKGIAMAVKYGMLAEGSTKRCLQVPELPFEVHAGAGSETEKAARRIRPCATCKPSAVSSPAQCHPDRERYTSAERGLCESCYRLSLKSKPTKTPGLFVGVAEVTPIRDEHADYWASVLAEDETA